MVDQKTSKFIYVNSSGGSVGYWGAYIQSTGNDGSIVEIRDKDHEIRAIIHLRPGELIFNAAAQGV